MQELIIFYNVLVLAQIITKLGLILLKFIPKYNMVPLYYRKDINDKWHWRPECPCFPKSERIQMKYFDNLPKGMEECEECKRLDKEGESKKDKK